MNDNRSMYAYYLGCYLLGIHPGDFTLDYVRNNPPQVDDKKMWLILSMLRNAPDLNDEVLYSMVREAL